jgi:hypothetical protein
LVAAAQNAREVDWGTRAEAAAYEISRFGSVQSSDLPPAIANLSLDVFIDVLNVIGGFGKRGYAELLKAGPHNFGRISQRLNQGYEQAMTWPASLRTFIQQHRSRGTRGGHTSVLRALKEVRRLKGTPAGEVLGDEWMSELVPEGGAEVPGAEEINLSQAAKRLGYSHFEMRLVNKVEGFAAKEGDFRLRFFSLAKFDDWVSQGKAWSKVQDVAARWMVENPALYDTCRLGVIGFDISATSLAFNTSPWRIRRYEIDEIEDLLTRPPEAVDGPGCSFSELRMPLYAVIQALRNEKLFACSWKPEHGLGHATFVAVERKPESTRARKSRLVDRFPRASVPSNSSNRRVALSSLVMHMGLGLGTLQRAWEGGFFGPTYGGPPPKDLDAMAVASFSALYVTSHLLVREGKAPSRNHVYEVLRRSKVRPANNPMKGTMSGSWHSTRFYRRSDLLSLDFTIDLK